MNDDERFIQVVANLQEPLLFHEQYVGLAQRCNLQVSELHALIRRAEERWENLQSKQ